MVVPGTPMTAPEMRDFSTAFGKPRAQLLRYKRNGEVPEVSTMVSTLMADGTTDKTAIRSEDWHTDNSYIAVPAKATLLHCMEIPSHGGRTWFCNMHSVYEALPEVDAQADRRQARHARLRHGARAQPAFAAHGSGDRRDAGYRASAGPYPSRHGRKALYLNFNRLDRIVGWSGPRAMTCSTSWRPTHASRSITSPMNGRSGTS